MLILHILFGLLVAYGGFLAFRAVFLSIVTLVLRICNKIKNRKNTHLNGNTDV